MFVKNVANGKPRSCITKDRQYDSLDFQLLSQFVEEEISVYIFSLFVLIPFIWNFRPFK